MSTPFIAVIIAIVMIFVGIVGGIKSSSSGKDFIASKVRIPIGVLGMLVIMFVGFYYGAIRPVGTIEHIYVGNEKLEITHPVETTQVIYPMEGDQVECRILTMGVYPEGLEKDIWIVLKPTDNRYYPQSDHTNVSYKRAGKWQVITRFGGDLEEKFEMIVYETDPVASEFFSATIQNWKDNLDYPGLELEEIPASAVEVDRINISLKGHCRGVF